MMYWNIGNRINRDILINKRAEYGRLIVVTLRRQLAVVHIGSNGLIDFIAKNQSPKLKSCSLKQIGPYTKSGWRK